MFTNVTKIVTKSNYICFRLFWYFSGDSVDANTFRIVGNAWIWRVERKMWCPRIALLFFANILPFDDQRASRRDHKLDHLHGLSQVLPVATWPNRRRVRLVGAEEEIESTERGYKWILIQTFWKCLLVQV